MPNQNGVFVEFYSFFEEAQILSKGFGGEFE